MCVCLSGRPSDKIQQYKNKCKSSKKCRAEANQYVQLLEYKLHGMLNAVIVVGVVVFGMS
jgi:hypothetical protein